MEALGNAHEAMDYAAGSGGLKRQIPVGMILAAAWRVYRENFWSIAILVSLIWVPLGLLSSYMDAFVFDSDEIRQSIRFTSLLEGSIGLVATAAVLSFGLAAFSGERITVSASFAKGLRAWGRVWLTRVFSGLILTGGLLLLVLPGIYLLARLCLADAVVVREGLSGRNAIRRSFELTQGRFWEIFRLGMALLGLALVLLVALVLPLGLIPTLDHWLASAALGLLFQLAATFGTLCFLGAYHEILHQESEDLRLAQAFE